MMVNLIQNYLQCKDQVMISEITLAIEGALYMIKLSDVIYNSKDYGDEDFCRGLKFGIIATDFLEKAYNYYTIVPQ